MHQFPVCMQMLGAAQRADAELVQGVLHRVKRRALAGEHQAPSAVFDGTDGEGPQNVTAFIGRKVEAKEHGRGALGALAEQAGWTMRLAFFAEGSKEASPEYEMEIFQLANGIAPRMVVDYRDFSVVLEIQKIEPIPPPACS